MCAEGAGRGAGRPGLRGPRGRAEGQRRPAGARPGQAGGRGTRRGASGSRAPLPGRVPTLGPGGRPRGSLPRTVLFPGKPLAPPGASSGPGGHRLSPHRPASSLRCSASAAPGLAVSDRKAPVPLGGVPTGGGGQLEAPPSQRALEGEVKGQVASPGPAPHSLRGAAPSCTRSGKGPGDTPLRIWLMKILLVLYRQELPGADV